MGPSGCGKSTFIRALSRINDDIRGFRTEGDIKYNGIDIYTPEIETLAFRKRMQMVFQKPNPFAMSIFNNVAYPAKIHGITSCKEDLDCWVEKCLCRSGLWDEVKDDLRGCTPFWRTTTAPVYFSGSCCRTKSLAYG